MMAAVLQAPLAALMAVMEMTANTNIILPAMVIIVVATLVTSQVFKQRSVFITTLNTLGLQYPPNPVTLHLQRVGVTAIMDRSFARVPARLSKRDAEETLARQPHWIVVEDEDAKLAAVLNPSDLSAYLAAAEEGEDLEDRAADAEQRENDSADEPTIRLLQIPGKRMDVTTIGSEATVMQLHEQLDKTQTEACCVTRTTAPMINPVIGVVTRSDIDNYRNTTA